jgi:hypothetical protein
MLGIDRKDLAEMPPSIKEHLVGCQTVIKKEEYIFKSSTSDQAFKLGTLTLLICYMNFKKSFNCPTSMIYNLNFQYCTTDVTPLSVVQMDLTSMYMCLVQLGLHRNFVFYPHFPNFDLAKCGREPKYPLRKLAHTDILRVQYPPPPTPPPRVDHRRTHTHRTGS